MNHAARMKKPIISVLESWKLIFSRFKAKNTLRTAKIYCCLKERILPCLLFTSTIRTSTYKLVKSFDQFLKPITTYEVDVLFAKETEKLDSNLITASFCEKSVFDNISVKENMGFCVENLLRNEKHIDSVSKTFL